MLSKIERLGLVLLKIKRLKLALLKIKRLLNSAFKTIERLALRGILRSLRALLPKCYS